MFYMFSQKGAPRKRTPRIKAIKISTTFLTCATAGVSSKIF